jgi:cytoskeletal protein RodZ
MRQRERQSGFSVTMLLLVVVAVGVVGVAGWFVYQHNRMKITDAAANPNQVSTQQAATTTPPEATTVVKIPELGIQIAVPNNIKDLTYKTNTVTLSNGNKGTYALLSTTSLTAADSKCGASSAALGSLEAATGQYPGNDPYAALDYGPLLKQFPTFYVTYAAPQGGCATGKSALTAQNTNKAAFQAALSTVQPLN